GSDEALSIAVSIEDPAVADSLSPYVVTENTQRPKLPRIGRPLTVLVADADPYWGAFLTFVLKGEGFTVVRADDGVEVMHQAQTRGADITVRDAPLQRLDACGLARWLKANAGTSHLPVVAITASMTSDVSMKWLDSSPCDALLNKPLMSTTF